MTRPAPRPPKARKNDPRRLLVDLLRSDTGQAIVHPDVADGLDAFTEIHEDASGLDYFDRRMAMAHALLLADVVVALDRVVKYGQSNNRGLRVVVQRIGVVEAGLDEIVQSIDALGAITDAHDPAMGADEGADEGADDRDPSDFDENEIDEGEGDEDEGDEGEDEGDEGGSILNKDTLSDEEAASLVDPLGGAPDDEFFADNGAAASEKPKKKGRRSATA